MKGLPLIVGTLALTAQGCFFPPDPSPWVGVAKQYRHNPRSLTQQTLALRDATVIAERARALKYISQGRYEATPADQAWAVLGLWQLSIRTSEGWPIGQSDWSYDERSLEMAARNALFDDAAVRAAFRQLGPALSPGLEREAWQSLRASLDRFHPDASAPATAPLSN